MDVKEEMQKYANELLYRIKLGRDYYSAYQELQSACKKHKQKIDIAKNFFDVVGEALLNSIMLETIKLFDKREEMSVPELYNKCKTTWDIKQAFAEDEDKFQRIEEAIEHFRKYWEKDKTKEYVKNIMTRRDKYYAHSDEDYFYKIQQLVDEASVRFCDLEDLLSAGHCFCSSIYELVSGQPWKACEHQGVPVAEYDFGKFDALLSMVEFSQPQKGVDGQKTV